MEQTQFVEVQEGNFTIIKNDNIIHNVVPKTTTTSAGIITSGSGKDAGTVQLVIDGDRPVNILEYLKSEMMEDKIRGNKENGSLIPVYDKDISLKIEVLEGADDTVMNKKITAMNPQEIAKQIRKKRKREKLWKPKNYVCGECGIAFISGKDLNRHKVVHTGKYFFYVSLLQCPLLALSYHNFSIDNVVYCSWCFNSR